MPRKKSAKPEEILIHFVRTRVNATVFKRLEKIRNNSDCHTIAEVARKILSKEQITVFYKDITLNSTMEELALIRKELRSIGININQLIRAYHSNKTVISQVSCLEDIAARYQTVELKTDRLFSLINRLAEKWLPRS